VLLNPRHGYGQNLNPCLDCKTFMVRKAYEWMREHGFDFIITGEVLGQRPMSQRRDTFPVVARESGVGDLLLRPLSAKLLPPTRPEREGWVDRERLYGFHGRTRKPQMELAARYGISPPAAAASSPTSSTRPSSPTCGPPGAGATTTSTTSCCSRSAGTCVRARTSSSSSGARRARTASSRATGGAF